MQTSGTRYCPNFLHSVCPTLCDDMWCVYMEVGLRLFFLPLCLKQAAQCGMQGWPWPWPQNVNIHVHSLFLDWSNVQWFSATSHHNITTARKPSTDLVPYHPLWSTRPSYWFFSIRMSNYIHAITCIIIYMGILLMQIQNTPPLNHSSPKTPSPPNHSKKTSPGCVLKSSPKNRRISSFPACRKPGGSRWSSESKGNSKLP